MATLKNQPYFIHTLEEIENHFPELPIRETWNNKNLAVLPLEQVEYLYLGGGIGEKVMDAYRAIWRNTVPRLSATLINWEF
jgi:phosphoribosylaminoimidazole-succinocarboxamide synthase